MIIKGHIRQFFSTSGKMHFLSQENVLLKDFGAYAEKITAGIKTHIESIASESGRPMVYLNSSKVSKEGTALEILKQDPVEEGLICIISTVELCKSVEVRKNKSTQKLELANGMRKCLYYYFYFLDKEFGFMHVKLQSWFPFEMQVYINGREYLSKQLDLAGIHYKRYDNCFIEIADIVKAQEIADAFNARSLDNMLNRFAKQINPFLSRIEEIFRFGYFWCMDQCEYATDVMFKSREALQSVYKDFVDHALLSFNCEDIMTFMGRKMHPAFSGEIVSDIKKRPQGVRIKHRMKTNSIKMYDKYSVLRVETTINDPHEFKIYKDTGKEENVKKWVPMGKTIANLYRYAQVAQGANKRYLDAVTLAEVRGDCIHEIEKLCEKTTSRNHTYTGFNLLSHEAENVFTAIMDGRNHINGFTNASIRKKIFPNASVDDKKVRNRTTRLLAKLRAHKLIAKIPHSFKYRVTSKGVMLMSAALEAKNRLMPNDMKKAL